MRRFCNFYVSTSSFNCEIEVTRTEETPTYGLRSVVHSEKLAATIAGTAICFKFCAGRSEMNQKNHFKCHTKIMTQNTLYLHRDQLQEQQRSTRQLPRNPRCLTWTLSCWYFTKHVRTEHYTFLKCSLMATAQAQWKFGVIPLIDKKIGCHSARNMERHFKKIFEYSCFAVTLSTTISMTSPSSVREEINNRFSMWLSFEFNCQIFHSLKINMKNMN